ncbi:MAG: tyrosine--tRNA ligase [Candidatus Saccharimonas sp.]
MTVLSAELIARNMVNQMTFLDPTELDKQTRTFYFGIDPSADSMQIGNLAAAMVVRQFMMHGYKAILLVGGATGLIGDPDGKKQERDLKDQATIDQNVAGITKEYQRIFEGMPFEVVNNYDWFRGIGYLDFLREVGKNVSLTQMLDREFVKERIGEGGTGISYAEFSYSLIQGYDFLHLFRDKGATLQLAGADQWGNSVAGAQLIRKLEGGEAHVFTTPLIVNKQTGVKFGKSEGGAIWLNPDKTSPYKLYQFWLNCDDETSEDLIKVYTTLDLETIGGLIAEQRENPGSRVLQRRLAHEVTGLVHGKERCDSVERVNEVLFGQADFASLQDSDLELLSQEIPTVPSGALIDILVTAGTAKSNGDARRLITSGAVSVNQQKVLEDQPISSKSLVKKGKNSFILVLNA